MQLLNDKKNILFITSWYPTEENPSAGIFVREHAKAVALYDKVEVIHLGSRNPSQSKLFKFTQDTNKFLTENITTYRFSVKSVPFLKQSSFILELYGIYRSINKLKHSDFTPEIIHAHILRAGFITILLRRMFKCPIVITEHSSAFPRKLIKRMDILKAKYAFNKADIVLPVSMSLQRSIEDYGIKSNFQIVPNVVDPTLFFPDISRKPELLAINMLFVGSLIMVKGLDFLFKALSSVSIQQNWHLDVVGTGLLENNHKQQCVDLGISDKVSFHGYLPKKSIAQMMRTSDLFVLPSLYESMPCVLVEAMASGLPVVASNVGGIPEIIDPDLGILCQPGDVDSLRSALTTAINHLNSYNKVEISKKAQKYSPESIGEMLHEIYISLLNQNEHS